MTNMPDQTQAQNMAPLPSSPKAAGKAPPEEVGLRVSLIPSEEANRRNPSAGFKHAVIAVAVASVIIGGLVAYLGYSVMNGRQEAAKIKAQAESYERQATEMSGSLKYAKLMQSRLRSLASLLGAHRNVAPVFAFFEKHTLQEVAFSSISIAENGTVNLSATASSFESYAAQISELRKQPEIKNLVSSGLSPSFEAEGGRLKDVAFTLVVNFDPSIFLSKGETR